MPKKNINNVVRFNIPVCFDLNILEEKWLESCKKFIEQDYYDNCCSNFHNDYYYHTLGNKKAILKRMKFSEKEKEEITKRMLYLKDNHQQHPHFLLQLCNEMKNAEASFYERYWGSYWETYIEAFPTIRNKWVDIKTWVDRNHFTYYGTILKSQSVEEVMVEKISNWWLKIYWSPTHPVGIKRFNRELDKLGME